MDDLIERASNTAMRLYGMRENESARVVADCRREIERLRRQVAQIGGMARQADDNPTAADRWLERIDEVVTHGPSDEYDEYALRLP